MKRALEDLGRRAQADPLFARAPEEADSTKNAKGAKDAEDAKGPETPANPRTAAMSEPTVRTSADGRISVLELSVPHPAPSAEAIESLTRLRQTTSPRPSANCPAWRRR